jgi:hypothetical protein
MAHEEAQAADEGAVGLQLPVGVVGPGDVRQLRRNLEDLEDTLQQMRLRTKSPVAKMPRASRLLEEFAATNRLNLLLPDDRQRTAAFLDGTIAHAPVLHMSFAAEASRAFTTELVLWLRKNIHPNVLLTIGLEPTLAAGCMLRTPNKQYDFSLRARFEAQAGLLAKQLHGEEVAAGE